MESPFESLYGVEYGQTPIRYPDERTMIVTHQGKEHRGARLRGRRG